MTDSYGQEPPLDPAVDPERWENAVGTIMEAARPELARRARQRGALDVLEGWARPVFALAASLVLVASAAILSASQDEAVGLAESGTSLNTVAEALVPSEVAAWLEVGHTLSADELVTALDTR